jgi:glycosyltransferase involved in cell wall biosynthesis
MRAISQEEFANFMKECVLSVWIDDISSFGTFPLESMKSGVPVIGKIPRLVPSWLNENNGIWVHDYTKMSDFVADFLQNWFEDNVSEKLYEGIEETAKLYSDKDKFDNSVKSNFGEYLSIRISNFQNELNKQLEQQPA